MFIRRAKIANIRSIEDLVWTPPGNPRGGWNVILGDNGSGKSSFLRAIALCLVGPKEAAAARQDWNAWLRSGTDEGSVNLQLARDVEFDHFSGRGKTGDRQQISAAVELVRWKEGVEIAKLKSGAISADRHIWGTGGGWFSVAYGPFRRFTGGDKEADRMFLSSPRLGAHVSVFGENIALTESIYWLRELNYKMLEDASEGHLLDRLKHFINQDGFLPHSIKLKQVSSRGVEFEDANGFAVAVEELSDGYRSILSMTFEFLRQILRVYPEDAVFDRRNESIIVPGVVMIDEIDAHLHPSWQKNIGFWLTRHFPNIQFIVTTHSPLVCQAAVSGSIFRLTTPGSKEPSRMLDGSDRDRLLYGDILDAYSTEAFGTAETRSSEGNEMQERLAGLNVKELAKTLSKTEREEQEKLRAIDVLRLNRREVLPRARREAFLSYRARIVEFGTRRARGVEKSDLDLLAKAVRHMQHPTVFHEMRRQREWLPELKNLFEDVPEALSW